VSTPFLTHAPAIDTRDHFGVADALARAAQRRSRLQSELRRLPPSREGWVQRRRQRLLADFVFATDRELAR
jgi:hypothetical protein